MLTNMIQEQQKQMTELRALVMANSTQKQPEPAPSTTLLQQMQVLLSAAAEGKQTGNRRDKGNRKRKELREEDISYCYTHGYTPNKKHNGFTCTNKCPGHKDEATKRNWMGGSIQNYDKYGVNFLA